MPEKPSYNQEAEQSKECVEVNPAKMEPLTAYNEEFLIKHVEEGQDVPIGVNLGWGDFYIRCDFAAFTDNLKTVTPERLEEKFVNNGKLAKQAPALDEDTRRLLHACWQTAMLVQKSLGDVGQDFVRDASFNRYSKETKSGKKVCIKPLSECKDKAVCAEYALLSQHILNKLGIPSSVIIGAFIEDPEELDTLANRHTYLVLKEGQLVYDPTHSALQEKCWPPKVFKAEKPMTIESLRDMSTDENEPFGRRFRCKDLLTKIERIYGTGAI